MMIRKLVHPKCSEIGDSVANRRVLKRHPGMVRGCSKVLIPVMDGFFDGCHIWQDPSDGVLSLMRFVAPVVGVVATF